jgi:hypothetical protein
MKLKLISWSKFKTIIFSILDHRVEFAEEIDGAVNNTYMSFDEHLIVYMF